MTLLLAGPFKHFLREVPDDFMLVLAADAQGSGFHAAGDAALGRYDAIQQDMLEEGEGDANCVLVWPADGHDRAAQLHQVLAGVESADELRQVLEAARTRALALIDAHFVRHPAPIRNVEGEDEDALNLLDYQVATRKLEGVTLFELRPEGFGYEPVYGERGVESYGLLPLAVLADVLDVLEEARDGKAGGQ